MDLSHIAASLSRNKWDWMVERLLLAPTLFDAAAMVRTVLDNVCIQPSSCLAVLGLAFLRMANDMGKPEYDADCKYSRFMDILRIPRPQPPPPPTPAPNPCPPPSVVPAATLLNSTPSASSPLATAVHTPSALAANRRRRSGHPSHASAASADIASTVASPDTPPSSRRRSQARDPPSAARKRDTTAKAVLEVTQDAIKSLATRRKHHPRHLDRLLALRWQAHLVSTGKTQLAASAIVSQVHFGRAASDKTHAARKANQSWQELKTTGKLEPASSYRPRKSRTTKDPIYAREFVERAKEKMVELTASKQNPGQVWRKLQTWINAKLASLLTGIVGAHVNPDSPAIRRSEYQVKRYMKYLGYQYMLDVKGAYTDGHDRADVVADRNKFIRDWRALEGRMPQVREVVIKDETGWPEGADRDSAREIEVRKDGSKLVSVLVYPQLAEGQKYLIPCFQDETTFHANDGARRRWRLKGTFMLMSKSRGAAIMVSSYTCPCHGELPAFRKTLEVGKNKDGYYDGKKFIAHFQDVIAEFHQHHPAVNGHEVEPLFIFDNAAGHKSFKPDALVASKVGLNVGGAQPKMRDTVWYSTDENGEQVAHHQQLVVEDDSPDVTNRGKLKGAKLILQERGLWPTDGVKLVCAKLKSKPDFIPCRQHIQEGRTPPTDNCCARRLLEVQPDFTNEKSWIEQVCEEHGVIFMNSPKFHPELNRMFISSSHGFNPSSVVLHRHRRNSN